MEEKEKYLKTKLKDYEIYTWIMIILSSYFYIGIILKTFADQFNDAVMLGYLTILFLGIASYLMYHMQQIYRKLEKHEQN